MNPADYAERQRAKYNARPAISLEFIRAMKEAVPLGLRWRLFTAIEMMPTDPDGVWSEMDSPFSGNPVSIDEVVHLCRLYQAVCADHVVSTDER